MSSVSVHRRCRACGGSLTEVLNLGMLRLNAFPIDQLGIESQAKVPHILCVCRGCSLTQLAHTVPPDWMFRQYWYRSSVNEAMQKELKEIAAQAISWVGRDLKEDDYILDIGANDGTLLEAYRTMFPRGNGDYSCRWNRVGVEPAKNLANDLRGRCEVAIHEYFPNAALDGAKRKFKIVTAIAMCYDLEDPSTFFRKITEVLHPDGIVIIQFQDLEQQLRCAAFDNIVAEHLEYYTLSSLAEIVASAGLYPVHVQHSPINGGSLRVLLKRGYVRPHDWPAACQEQLRLENKMGLSVSAIRTDLQAFERFARRVGEVKRLILDSIAIGRQHGTVTAYGASTKGNTLLQVLNLGPTEILHVADRSPEKHGRLTITGIPIVSEEEWRQTITPCTLVPIWQFREGVVKREAAYLEKGGAFLFPLPYSEIVMQRRG